jgi:hypothetical protein
MIELRQLRAPVALLSLVLTSGCSALDNCPDAQGDITITTGTSDKDALTYDSDPGGKAFDAFPAKTLLIFKHELGATPLLPQLQLSFAGNGTNGDGGGSFAFAAGNEALFECMDSHVIVVKNDTCERSFFVRLTTVGVDPAADPDACASYSK